MRKRKNERGHNLKCCGTLLTQERAGQSGESNYFPKNSPGIKVSECAKAIMDKTDASSFDIHTKAKVITIATSLDQRTLRPERAEH